MTFNRRQLIYLWIGLGLFLTAFIWDAYFSTDNNIKRYKGLIENYLHHTEKRANALLEDKKRIFQISDNKDDSGIYISPTDTKWVHGLKNENYNFCIFRETSVLFWSHNDVLPLWAQFTDTLTERTFSKFVEIDDSQFELRFRNYRDEEGRRIVASALIPIKNMYPSFEGKYLKSHFPASFLIPTNLDITESKQRVGISNIEKKTLCYISNEGSGTDNVHDWGMVILLCFAFLMIGRVGDMIAKQMLEQYESPTIGIIFFVSIFSFMLYCVMKIQKSRFLSFLNEGLGNFSNNPHFVKSLPAFFIYTIFLFWVSTFINNKFKMPNYAGQSFWKRWSLATAFYCLIVLLLMMCVGTFNDLTTTDSLLDTKSLLEFKSSSIFTLFVLGLLMISIFLLTHRSIISINQLKLNPVETFLAVDVAVSLGMWLFYIYNMTLPFYFFGGLIVVYLAIFHKFITYEKPGLIWLVNWVIVFSIIQTFFVYRFNFEKTDKLIKDYATNLARERDTLAERKIKTFVNKISSDPLIYTHAISPIKNDVDGPSISKRILKHYNADEYLSNQYSVRFLSYYQNAVALIQEDSLSLNTLFTQFENGIKFDNGNPNIRFWSDKKGKFSYLALTKIPISQTNPVYVGIEIKRHDRLSSRVFTELLVNNHYKGLRSLSDFDYAIYKNGVLKENNSLITYAPYITQDKLPATGAFKDTIYDNRKEITHKNTEGLVVKIGYEHSMLSQVLTIWVFTFIVLAGLLIVFSLVNYFFPFLPEIVNFNLAFSFNTSLHNRILLPSIGFILLSFFTIFMFTMRYYKIIDEKYYNADLENKSNAITSYMVKDLERLRMRETTNTRDSVNQLLDKFAQSYQTAIHYYDVNGALYATTEDNIFERGFFAKRMNSVSLAELNSGKEKIYKSKENFGDFEYKTAFYSIQDSSNKSLGYLELPFYSRDRKSRAGITDVWTENATILALLFILGICFIYIQTTKNLEPIKRIAEFLQKLELGKKVKYELITSWNKKDEIAVLIDAYNNKVTQLQDAITRLTEAEREVAWREMAQQVAHEVRNPLTPMKLVVQHLEMIRKQKPESLKEYLEKSNKMLLDQIETLERIVSEFSSFAKIPQKANNEMFILNDLVQSVGDLFSQYNFDNKPINFMVNVPDEEHYIVYADRAMITGALNNLAKNAIQAIPDGREGRIIVSLYKNMNKAIIRISDNGSGIPKEIQDKIFTPYFTTKQYGTGLGLLITKNVLNAVNGNITFDTRENEGTDFFIELEIQEIEKKSLPESDMIPTK